MLILEPVVVLDYSPRVRKIYHGCRPHSSFFYIASGEYRYTFKNTFFTASAGDVVYLPKYSRYTMRIQPGETRCIQAEFDLFRKTDTGTEEVLFADVPTVIRACSDEVRGLFLGLEAASHNELSLMAVLFHLLTQLFGESPAVTPEGQHLNRVRPAVDYLYGHYLVRPAVPELAAMCGLSEPHFRRLFRELTGTTPVKFRNRCIMDRACIMLEGGMAVGEVASALNFNDIYSFSVAFRKEFGMSPRAWAAAHGDAEE